MKAISPDVMVSSRMWRWFAMAFLLVSTCMHAASTRPIEQAFDAMSAINRDVDIDNATKAERLGTYYDAHLAAYQSPDSLAKRSTEELLQLFRATRLAYFYSYGDRYLEPMRRDLEALAAREPLPKEEARDFYAALIANRHFGEAETFRRRYPLAEMPAMPPVEDRLPSDAAEPTALAIEKHGAMRVLRREVANVTGPGAWVLVISHPLCHFSQNATRDIAADPVLAPLFRDRAQWLAPQESAMALPALVEWNHAHPDFPMGIAYKQSDWPMVSSWATPTFYFFKDGRVVRQVIGWPREGNRDALMAALREIGLAK